MALTTLKEILSAAEQGNYAVGAFGGMDLISFETVLRTAEARGTPVILLNTQLTWRNGRERDAQMFFEAANAMMKAATVPTTMILDHGNSYEACMRAIGYGFRSVMFDGSSLPVEENIRITRKIVEAAHNAGVSVEAEIGHVGGLEGHVSEEGSVADASLYTKPEDAERFVEQTGVDALAVAIGSVHGVYRGTPKLDIARLDQIRARLGSLPLVLHGGSGIPDEEFRQAVAHGIRKVNIYTGMVTAAGSKMRQCVEEKQGRRITFTELVGVGRTEMANVVNHHIDVFGTQSVF